MFRVVDAGEKRAVSEQCNAKRMGDGKAPVAETRKARPTAALRPAGDGEYDRAGGEEWLHLADGAKGFSALAAGLLLFCEVASAGRVAAAQ